MTYEAKSNAALVVVLLWVVLQLGLVAWLGFARATPLVYATGFPMCGVLYWLFYIIPDKY